MNKCDMKCVKSKLQKNYRKAGKIVVKSKTKDFVND